MLRGVCLAALGLVLPSAAYSQSELPAGFGGINIGDNWNDVQDLHNYRVLDEVTNSWDEHILACGYQTLLIEADKGDLLITVQNSVITSLSYTTPIKPDSNLLQVADLVMQTYGQPDRASMRNLFGRVTISKEDVNFVLLEYVRPQRVEFTISGRGLWQYRTKIRHKQFRWHENQSRSCARERQKEARKLAQQTAAAGS